MTLIGAWTDIDQAWIWGDTEFYQSLDAKYEPGKIPGQPLDHRLKLFVNERAAFAAAGAGDDFGNRSIKAAVEFAGSFDEFVPGLANLLNDQAGWCSELPPWTCIAAGWSRRLGRMAGVLLRPPNFRPQYSSIGFVQPYVHEFDGLFPGDASDILGLAQSQMRVIQKSYPGAGAAGSIIVAHLQRDKTSLTAFDIPTWQRLPSPPNDLREVGPPILFRSHLLEGKNFAGELA